MEIDTREWYHYYGVSVYKHRPNYCDAKEHSLFLSEGFNRRDTDLIREANRFFALFETMLQEALEFNSSDAEQVFRFNETVIRAVSDLRNFKQEVLTRVILCRIDGFNLRLLIDHIRREAEYFITVLVKLNEGIDEPVEAQIVRENVFWLRIMADHSRFIRNFLDPSERGAERRLGSPRENSVRIIY